MQLPCCVQLSVPDVSSIGETTEFFHKPAYNACMSSAHWFDSGGAFCTEKASSQRFPADAVFVVCHFAVHLICRGGDGNVARAEGFAFQMCTSVLESQSALPSFSSSWMEAPGQQNTDPGVGRMGTQPALDLFRT